jgi:hypothetical protein
MPSTRWPGFLRVRGDLDQLHRLADHGHRPAADELATLLIERGHLDEARALLRGRGDRNAAQKLTELFGDTIGRDAAGSG